MTWVLLMALSKRSWTVERIGMLKVQGKDAGTEKQKGGKMRLEEETQSVRQKLYLRDRETATAMAQMMKRATRLSVPQGYQMAGLM